MILNVFTDYGLDFNLCHGQAYDNGANMAGKYSGIQAILLQKNPLAIFSPCGAHTLNLVGADSAESSNDCITFFESLQALYNIFSSSPVGNNTSQMHFTLCQ